MGFAKVPFAGIAAFVLIPPVFKPKRGSVIRRNIAAGLLASGERPS